MVAIIQMHGRCAGCLAYAPVCFPWRAPALRLRGRPEEPNGRPLGRLLRARRQRPRYRAAQKRDELAPFHVAWKQRTTPARTR